MAQDSTITVASKKASREEESSEKGSPVHHGSPYAILRFETVFSMFFFLPSDAYNMYPAKSVPLPEVWRRGDN
jgi:hypothetical protein